MKKFIFTLVAAFTVLGSSYGNSIFPEKNMPQNAKSYTLPNAIVAPGCMDFTVGVNVGVTITTVVRVCCKRNVSSSGWSLECWFVSNKTTGDLTGYINVAELDPKVSDAIKSKGLSELAITGSNINQIGDYKYAVKTGMYKIEKTDEGTFITVTLERAK